jgi:hypothetical protein
LALSSATVDPEPFTASSTLPSGSISSSLASTGVLLRRGSASSAAKMSVGVHVEAVHVGVG